MKLRKKKKTEDPQYDLGLKEPVINKFFTLRSRLSKLLAIFETKRFYKSSTIWALLITLTVLNALLLNYFNYISTSLPSEIPFQLQSMDLTSRLVKTDSLRYIPYFTIFGSIIGVVFSNRLYNQKEYLSLMILITEISSVLVLFYNIIIITSNYL